jgi:hypothetical protein
MTVWTFASTGTARRVLTTWRAVRLYYSLAVPAGLF